MFFMNGSSILFKISYSLNKAGWDFYKLSNLWNDFGLFFERDSNLIFKNRRCF